MTNILSKYAKKFAIIASILMIAVIAIPMVAAETNYEYYCDEAQSSTTDITLSDFCGAEIEIINGLPYIVAEVEDEYINIPLPLSNTADMIINNIPITVEIDENYRLIPTKDGIERVCISEFDVKVINGEMMLMHEINPGVIETILLGLLVTFLAMGIVDIADAIGIFGHEVGLYKVNKHIHRSEYEIVNYDFNIAHPARDDVDSLYITVRLRDFDRNEKLSFYFINPNGCDIYLGTSGRVLRNPSIARIDTDNHILDEIQNIITANHGRFQIRIKSDFPTTSDGVFIYNVATGIGY